MKPGTSLYLDLVRFLAALAVFITHAGLQRHLGGLFWQFRPLGTPAVSVFFVLSGFVIAHVLSTRENTLVDYTASRLGRLYSVVLPALILTAVCDFFGSWRAPELYEGLPTSEQFAHYIASLFFLNRFWFFTNLEPGSNAPYWSLSFEAAYYCAIALLFFTRGLVRIIGTGILAFLAGPAIILLAPIWFIGYGLYHISSRVALSFPSALALFAASLFGMVLSVWLQFYRYPLEFSFLDSIPVFEPVGFESGQVGNILCRYVSGISFAVSILSFDVIGDRFHNLIMRVRPQIVRLGSLTFALYLFHDPLIRFFTAYNVGAPETLIQRLWLIGGTFLIVIAIGQKCEQSRTAYKQFFLKVLRQSPLNLPRSPT